MNLPGSTCRKRVGFFAHGNEPFGYIKAEKLTSVQMGFEVCPASYSLGNGGSFLGDQQAGVRN